MTPDLSFLFLVYFSNQPLALDGFSFRGFAKVVEVEDKTEGNTSVIMMNLLSSSHRLSSHEHQPLVFGGLHS